ncbi:MAG: hypothetical protein Ct9H300mP21_00300 [Pseudomonadota bacterium]|nr:MAG: hypothetical protein Ct9H300mP21_00300 [Pseudomonadota bacterium]
MARELDDAIMHLSFNELELGTWVFVHKVKQTKSLLSINFDPTSRALAGT